MASWTSKISGPKWALGDFEMDIKELAWKLNLEIKVDTSKGWFDKQIVFKATGEYKDLEKFQKILLKSIDSWNGD